MTGVATPYLGDRSRSPIVTASVGSIVFAFLSVGFIASYLPVKAPMVWPVSFLIVSAALWIVALVMLARLHTFAWPLFLTVIRWVSILPLVFAALAIFVFVSDGTGGLTLAIMIAVLVLAAANIPLVIGFSVARHEPVASTTASQ